MFIRLGGVALRRGSEVLLQRVMVGRRIRFRRERTEFVVVWLGRTYTALESSATLGRSAGNARRQLLVIGSQLSERLRRLCIECRQTLAVIGSRVCWGSSCRRRDEGLCHRGVPTGISRVLIGQCGEMRAQARVTCGFAARDELLNLQRIEDG